MLLSCFSSLLNCYVASSILKEEILHIHPSTELLQQFLQFFLLLLLWHWISLSCCSCCFFSSCLGLSLTLWDLCVCVCVCVWLQVVKCVVFFSDVSSSCICVFLGRVKQSFLLAVNKWDQLISFVCLFACLLVSLFVLFLHQQLQLMFDGNTNLHS